MISNWRVARYEAQSFRLKINNPDVEVAAYRDDRWLPKSFKRLNVRPASVLTLAGGGARK